MRIKLRTNPPSRPGSRHSISFLLVSLLASGMPAIAQVGGPAQVLTAADVTALITTAATALDEMLGHQGVNAERVVAIAKKVWAAGSAGHARTPIPLLQP